MIESHPVNNVEFAGQFYIYYVAVYI